MTQEAFPERYLLNSSPVGNPATIRKMLEFSSRHNINPVIDHFPVSKVNDAMEHLRQEKAKYRLILDSEG